MAVPKNRVAGFDPVPSIKRSAEVTIGVAKSMPTGDGCVGVPVGVDGAVPRELDLDRTTLTALRFDGEIGQTLAVPRRGGPSFVLVGIGNAAELDASKLRDAAAAFARASAKRAQLTTTLADVASVRPEVAGQAVVEGVLLARYGYHALKQASATALADLSLVAAPQAPTDVKGTHR